MAGHRYWRLLTGASWGDISGWGTEAREIEFRVIRDGADATGSGTAISDAGTAANAFDNNDSTVWAVNNAGVPHYIGYDFGEGNGVFLSQFTWKSVTSGQFKSKFPKFMDLQYSDDGVAWATLQSFDNFEPYAAGVTVIFNVDAHHIENGDKGGAARGILNNIIDARNGHLSGFMDYQDTATAGTPITPAASTWTKLTNNELGARTRKNFAPGGVTDLWNPATNQFDFSQLAVGDMLAIRFTVDVTTTVANVDIAARMSMAIGSATPFFLTLGGQFVKSSGTKQVTGTIHAYIGADFVRLNPAEMQIWVDNATTDFVVDGWAIFIQRNGFQSN
jgi:hypothetical protein